MMISSKKKIAVITLTSLALSLGSLTGASAAGVKPKSEVSKAKHEARKALVVSVIGLDAQTIKSRLQAGETLGSIAGENKAALIAAVVEMLTTKIDASVSAGRMSAARASALKSELTAHVTAKVDAVRGEGGHQGHKRQGKGVKG